jgi:hypothetical protein
MLADSRLLLAVLCVVVVHFGCGGRASSGPNVGTPAPNPANFSCPAGQEDVMEFFALNKQARAGQFMNGQPNPIYTEVFPDEDFAANGYWFWLKSAGAHGFDVKAFDQNYVYIRSTELTWTDNTTFKRFNHDLPIAPRCLAPDAAGPEIQSADTEFQYFASCSPYKASNLASAVTNLDAPRVMDTGGNIGQQSTRVLHYRYNCDSAYQNCVDEEQYYLAKPYGIWQWKHYRSGGLVNSALMNNLMAGTPTATLPCSQSYQ